MLFLGSVKMDNAFRVSLQIIISSLQIAQLITGFVRDYIEFHKVIHDQPFKPWGRGLGLFDDVREEDGAGPSPGQPPAFRRPGAVAG